MNHAGTASRAEAARSQGQEVVVVLGLGFVGTAVAANLARVFHQGDPRFFVIGLEQDLPAGRAKAERLHAGLSPTFASDPALQRVISSACRESRNLASSVDPRVLEFADVIVVCINLDLLRAPGQTEELSCTTDRYADAMRLLGKHMRPGTLVCVESTLPLGACDRVLYPALCESLAQRGVDVGRDPPSLAYCYERVMPGPEYLDSVNHYWRAYAGIDERSAQRAGEFLSKFVDVDRYPLWRHKTIRAAEMAKLLENSYRATNIAFIEEWARLAEQVGVDLFDVIRSIRLRKGTHDNLMLPGLGVGGYCLTKDALLAAWGAQSLLGAKALLPFSRQAVLTNETMPLRALELIRAHFRGALRGRSAALLGISYRVGVADTRSSATQTLASAMLAEGMSVRAFDPLIGEWEEMPGLELAAGPESAIAGADALVLCLPDPAHLEFLGTLLPRSMKPGSVVIDPWNLIADSLGPVLAQSRISLHVFGRGDIQDVASTPAKCQVQP